MSLTPAVDAASTPAPVGVDAATAVSELFACLASPVRVRLIEQLVAGEACVHELVDALGLPQPLVSQHLRVLRGARLVTRHRRGREMAYALADDHVAHIVADALTHAREHGDHG
jgi:DNA-binding transcriptional ArsR family regulator